MAYKDKEKKKAYDRVHGKKYYQEHKRERRKYYQEGKEGKAAYEKLKKRAHKILGNVCMLCGSKNDLELHEKKGRKHAGGVSGLLLVLKYPERFRLLCNSHHRLVHDKMKKTGFSFEEILFYKKLLFG